MVRSFGPARLPKERMSPFQGGGPPPATGGATAPMPVAMAPAPVQQRGPKFNRDTVPIRREYFPPRRGPEPPPAPPPPEEPQRKPKRKAPQQAGPVSLKKPHTVPRGPGHRLGDDEPAFVPFSGRAQRLPDEVVINAKERMLDIARRHQQQTSRKQDFAKLVENERKQRRGGERGDVVALGKRKEPEPDMPRSMLRKAAPQGGTRSRQRLYGPGTQLFDIGM